MDDEFSKEDVKELSDSFLDDVDVGDTETSTLPIEENEEDLLDIDEALAKDGRFEE